MIFLDTSAIYPLADKADPNHQSAVAKFQKLLRSGERIVLHNYILVERMSFILMRRKGITSVFCFDPDFVQEGFTVY